MLWSRAAIVAINDAFFHDEEHLFRLPNIFSRIARNGDDIGEFSGVQRTDLILQREKFGIGDGCGTQRIDGLHTEINHQVELFGVAAVLINRGVGAEADLDALGQSMLKHLRAGRQGGSRFRNDSGRQIHAFVDLFAQAFAGDKRWD